MVLCNKLLSFSIFSRFIYEVACISPLWPNNIPLYIYTHTHITICLSLCWLADIWVVSCLLANMNTAAMKVNVYFVRVWACIFISLNCILRSRAAGFQPSFNTHNWKHWVCDASLISLKHFPVTILDFLHFIHLIITENYCKSGNVLGTRQLWWIL